MKRCLVVYATRARQYQWSVALGEAATIAEALGAARLAAQRDAPELDPALWERAPVGVFGRERRREMRYEDGDRIELYRPLRCDPRARRRERVQRERRAARSR
ncbi:MAG TPA: RnfH family protein [Steroidobacteraceae bacterium]|nr:RnfH family protein [Steroidobacteraceae bacterium]